MENRKKTNKTSPAGKSGKVAKVAQGRPRKLENWTVEVLRKRAEGYFLRCDSRTKQFVTKKGEVIQIAHPAPYTVAGLCCYLRILRNEFDRWLRMPDDLGREAQMIMQRILDNRESGAADNSQSPSFNQFALKNMAPDQYRDKVEIENSISGETAKMFQAWSEQWKQI